MKLTPNEIRLKDTMALEGFVKSVSHDTRLCIAVWCLECLTAEQVVEVLADSVPDLGLRLIADRINALDLECDRIVDMDACDDNYGRMLADDARLVAELLAEAKARKGGAP